MNKDNVAQQLFFLIFSDFTYQQDFNFEYINAPKLQEAKINDRCKALTILVKKIFLKTFPKNLQQICDPEIDILLFCQAMARYSRDVYGQRRLQARLKGVPDADIVTELSKFSEYGFKINSSAPYRYREIAVFMYWFSVLKPFSLSPKENVSKERMENVYCACYNEFMTYYLVQLGMRSFGSHLTIHEDLQFFEDFLTDLHFRNLSRSSLEFFLNPYKKAK